MIDWYSQPRYHPFSLTHEGADPDRAGVMMIHGFTGTPDELRPSARIAHDAGFDVEVIGVPGMGADIGNLRHVDRHDWLRRTLATWQDFTARYRHRLLLGYSLGAALAIHASVARPADAMILMSPMIRLADIRSVVLPIAMHIKRELAPFGDMDFTHPEVRDFFERTMPGLDIDRQDVQDAIRRDFVTPTRLINDCRLTGREAGRKARFVNEPVTIIQGRPDGIVGHQNARWLADHLAGPVTYHEIDGDHLIPFQGGTSWPIVGALLKQTFSKLAVDLAS